MLMLHRGASISEVVSTFCCVRSSVGRWNNWLTLSGVEGQISLPAGDGLLNISAPCHVNG
ncbi:helix-turn-helix domain-containing protein [Enterobacter ludwigii]|nr:helix-turn-helix domain-containing protein [Enterobacter ludwigii]MBX8910996.1 helix-turn-helix domain-containing protein [Enterobacter ludwigii]RTO56175.1 helix-turn-helix domain-containing protein [Enterobacter ludwigii]